MVVIDKGSDGLTSKIARADMKRFEVGALDHFLHGCVDHVAALAVIGAQGRCSRRAGLDSRGWKLARRRDDAIDEAADVFGGHDRAQSRNLAERYVQHQAAAAIGAAMRGLGHGRVGRPFELAQLGLIGNELDGAAHRTRTVEGALRTTQSFHVVEIEQVGIDDGASVQRNRRGRERRFVDVKADGRRGAAARGQAPHFVFGLTRARRAQRNAGHLADQILDVLDVFLSEIGGAQGRDADGRCLDSRFALLGGDDDLFQAGIVFGRRIAGGTRRPCRAPGGCAYQRGNHRRSDSCTCVCCTQHLFHDRISLRWRKQLRDAERPASIVRLSNP